jgi:hypothetical protein
MALTLATSAHWFWSVPAAVAAEKPAAATSPPAVNLREPVLRLPPTAKAPVIDGKIEAAEWAGAWMMEGSVSSGDQNLEQRLASAYIGYDKENLYLAIRSATRPGGKLCMWEHDPDEWLSALDNVEFWVSAPATPAAAPIDRYQICFDPYGTQWALVHRYGAGFNVQEKLNRVSSIHDDVWDIELAFPWRLLNLKPEDITDGRHILVRPCRAWKYPFLYTSWGGWGGFYKNDSLIRVILDGQAPVIRIPALGDLFAGKAEVKVEVVNSGAAPVAVRANLEIGTYEKPAVKVSAPGTTAASATKDVTVAAGKSEAVTLSAAFKPLDPASPRDNQVRATVHSLKLDVTRAADGAVLFSRFLGLAQPRPDLWEKQPLREIKLRGGYYPYYGKIKVGCDLGDDPRAKTVTRAAVSVVASDAPGKAIATGAIPSFRYNQGEVALDVGALPAGEYLITGEVFAGDQKLALEKPLERKFKREVMPWENTRCGIAEKVYPPFTPIAVKENTLSTVLRDHTFDGLGLWSQVVAKGEPILAAPMRLEAKSNGKTLEWKTPAAPRFTKKAGHETTLEGEASCAALVAKTKCLWEYDGMMKVELDLAPAGGGQVDEFELVIPVKAHLATLLHSTTAIRSNPSMEIPIGKGVVWDSRSMVQTLGKGSFIPYIWIGGAERGVCWFADNDKGWITDDKEPAIEVERAGDIVNLRVRFVNKPGVVKAPRRIVFGLMATPVKPIPAESRAWWGDSASPRSFVDHLPSWRFAGFSDKETLDPLGGDFSIFQYFAKHQGTGKAPTDAEKVLGDWMRKNGLEPEKKGGPFGDLKQGFSRTVANSDIAFYTNPALEDGGTPQGRQFNNEWHGGVSGMGCNFVKSYNDYAAWCYDQILATGLKCGMYQDNTFPVASTDVIAGGAYVREDGSIQAGWNIFGHREFYKRLFVVGWERMGRLPLIYPHTTNGMTIPLFSFATIHLALEWEQGSLRTFQEKFKFPLLRTEVMGKQAGMIPRVLCGMWDGAADLLLNGYLHRTREGVGLLHDSYPRGLQPYIGNVIKELIPLGFHKESCEFIGYWDKPAGVKAPEGTEVSLFKMEKGVLAVVVDTSGKDGARRVAFDAKALRREIKTIRDFEADLLAAKQADPKAGKQYKPDYKAYDAMWVYYPPTDRAFKAVDGRTVEFNLRRHDYALLLAE